MALFQLLTGLGFLLEGRAQLAMVMAGMCKTGMSMATALTWFFNFLLAVTFPKFQDAFGNTGAFGYYAAWCAVGWFLILLYVPETKGLTLEQLDARFSISSRSHARFAVRQCIFVVKYYILQRRHTKRPTLELPPQEVVYGESKADQPRKISFEKDDRMFSPASFLGNQRNRYK
ncbi:MAG: hypothetical protein Q9219_006801 [cf. Caloplaca sp. 3 TL-2023]